MRPMLLTMFAAGGLAFAQHNDHGDRNVKLLSENAIVEKLDGKKTTATTVEVILKPGQASAPHRHPGPAFGYVLEGEYEWAIDDKPVRTLKAGETFYEPTGCLHRVSKNASDKNTTRVIALVLHPHSEGHRHPGEVRTEAPSRRLDMTITSESTTRA